MALFSNPSERKVLLIKAINLFEKQNDKLQEMATRISLSQHLGYSGELNAALEHLKIAEEISKHEIDGYFITQNNLAVISLFSHIASPECGAQLERALNFCSNDNYLDRLIIINNLLIYSSITKSISEAMDFISKLEEILVNYCDSLDYDLKRITLFNIAQHHRDTPLHKFYIEKAREIPLTIDCEYWNYRLNNHKPISKNFRMLHEYYPIFISNWNLDFDIFLNS